MAHTPTSITVDSLSTIKNRAAASWSMNGARFHVWFDVNTMEIERDYAAGRQIIYKNAIVARSHPDWFDTRKLDAESESNAAIVATVFKRIKEHNLISAAFVAEEEKERKRIAENKEYERQERIKEAAPELLTALMTLCVEAEHAERHMEAKTGMTGDAHAAEGREIRLAMKRAANNARAIISKATGAA